ncbi:hypothetical protein DNTS_000603 [Danionella cerebrum]|uniref:Uncharacterized protein n=1 Tax=Danionella cerebrum TaxID=2873325 RepID=A0A553REV9_9TELE|nr:hypothetical protein DNTS_000603 [Danionella translucida]
MKERYIQTDAHPGLKFLELFFSTLHGQILSLIQTVLQVLHSDLKILLHPLKMSTECLASYISDGFLGLLLSISGFLNCIINFTLDLNKVSLKLLLGVQETCVL